MSSLFREHPWFLGVAWSAADLKSGLKSELQRPLRFCSALEKTRSVASGHRFNGSEDYGPITFRIALC